ncbi:metallophosphoesterase family protein [Clostridium faecium]|uniref:Metallophosphoesterase family protein n=1 Tax=Clostridium faecium TaxID=2762223 RepID=A0ABR8YQ19_9CLOT|nr:metallophosphoesterase family protein [Clostridium faecium]MBD8045999.1 metallophosphoesterase family protein [Clostridium faecium]
MGKEKVIVTADIHANIHALNVFLDYLNNEEVSHVLNLGDFIQEGPNPVEVFDVVMNDERFINILGNNEHILINRKFEDISKEEIEHQNWNIELLGKERICKLKTLPTERIIKICDKKILMVHSRIDSMVELPLLYKEVSLDKYTEDYGDICDYVLIGHTHYQSLIKHWTGSPIINPGSIGCSKDGLVNFAILEFDGNTVDISFKTLRYNLNAVITDFFKYNVPDKEHILECIYGINYKDAL